MPLTPKKPAAVPAPPPATDPPPTPQFVTVDDFRAAQVSLTQQLETISAGLQALAAARRDIPAPAERQSPVPAITADQFDEAMATGDAKTVRAYLGQQQEAFRQAHVAPIQLAGFEAISGLTRSFAESSVSEEFKPYVTKYKAEIDQYLAGLPPAMQMRPEAHKLARDAVLGAHMPEIMADQRERFAREAADPANAGVASGRGRGAPTAEPLPTVEELLGKDAADALRSKGKDEEWLARTNGMKTYKEYVDLVRAQAAETEVNA